MPTAILSACPLFAESNERGPKGDMANRGGIPIVGTKYVPPLPRNSLSPTNHPYPAQTWGSGPLHTHGSYESKF